MALPFTAAEARSAVQRRAALASVPVSPLEADNLAGALGKDPLLIALYDFTQKPEPQQVITDFIDGNLRRLASDLGNLTLTDYRRALRALAWAMLLRHRDHPTWTEVQEWMVSQPGHLVAMRHILRDGKIVRLADDGEVERHAFRHDRVLDRILSDGIAEMMQTDQVPPRILAEPFFAEVIGVASAAPNTPVKVIERVRDSNPVALFYAFKLFREPATDVHHTVLRAIHLA